MAQTPPVAPQQQEDAASKRRTAYLQYCAANDHTGGRDGVFSQIARLELGLPVNESIIREGIAFVYTGKDCNDFTIGGLARLLYLHRRQPQLSPALVKDIEKCLLDFKYWWDDPRQDIQYRCYHTENHQGLYHSNELLAGQLLATQLFTNGMDGRQHTAHAKERLDRWLNFRSRFGFSEWLSNAYYDVDIMILANLYDFAEDAAIRARAGLLLDVLMYDMSLNNYQGTFGSTHGRAYSIPIRHGTQESTASAMKLLFGVGVFHSPVSLGAVSLATSAYRCPELIQSIATDYTQTIRTRQRQSINVEEAAGYGLKYDDELDTHLFWGMQEFIHPLVINMSKQLSEKYNTWPYKNYQHYLQQYEKQVQQYGKVINPRLDRFALSEANIETLRTPDYMLSCTQDYRPGSAGYQQHIWQATMGAEAIVFTNHPGSRDPEGIAPNCWAGNATLPRAAQYNNVLISIYHIAPNAALPFSHAYFPKHAFDEVVEKGHWVFARKNNGYLALYSQHPVQWEHNKEGQPVELRTTSPDNAWICEMGAQSQWKSFTAFINAISAATVQGDSLAVSYASPSLGAVQFGWSAPFTVKGAHIPLDKYPRFENQYSRVPFTAPQLTISRNKEELVLDFTSGKRIVRTPITVHTELTVSQERGGLKSWPKGAAPQEVGKRITDRYLVTPHTNFGMPGPPGAITYSEVCTWYGALRVAGLTKDKALTAKLEDRFLPLLYEKNRLQPKPDHVDHTVFGTLPLELYRQTGNTIYGSMGKWFADEQWNMPANEKPEYRALLDKGYTWQTRLWIDDMYMITAIQAQAFRITGDRKYIDRAAQEMALYLDSIQQSNGLFFHAKDVPFFWGRGNGWMAAGMTELLRSLPKDNPHYPRILQAYRTMMTTLKQYQRADGMWGQLVDDPGSWAESSCTGMFTYALITGVKKGWLDKKEYEPVARKGWLALVSCIDEQGDVREVCEGTNKKNDRQYYLDRRRITGDMHGQAPVLWCVYALLEK
ncbi:glycoside hydrolase family 88/105 protein [Paraflavitalea devenefica]|uniref:glycoside hydrolase family 88/105 protein n=1 Tax=Paraflavitalea devenefica TaxID=2716334 RepID=UPI001FE2D7E4|nr:glycoside hydrolase family 88 protein [Paraflavitalea devenefica]